MAQAPLVDRINYKNFTLDPVLTQKGCGFLEDRQVLAWKLEDDSIELETDKLGDRVPVGLVVVDRPRNMLGGKSRVDSGWREKAAVINEYLNLRKQADGLRDFVNAGATPADRQVRKQLFKANCVNLNRRLIESVCNHELDTNMLGKAKNPDAYERTRIALGLPEDASLAQIKAGAIASLTNDDDKSQAVAEALRIGYITTAKQTDYFGAHSIQRGGPVERASVVHVKRQSTLLQRAPDELALAVAAKREFSGSSVEDSPPDTAPPLPPYPMAKKAEKDVAYFQGMVKVIIASGSEAALEENVDKFSGELEVFVEQQNTGCSDPDKSAGANKNLQDLQLILASLDEKLAGRNKNDKVQALLGRAQQLGEWLEGFYGPVSK